MASLDNWHTGNGRRMQYPSLRERWSAIGKALYTPTAFDIPNEVPVATVNVRDPLRVHASGHEAPQITSTRDTWINTLYVPTTPYTHMIKGGDTVDSLVLYNPGQARQCPLRKMFRGGQAPLGVVDHTYVYRNASNRKKSWFTPY